MTAKELAERLNGREYGAEMTKEEEREAKAAGLVVVFGASDDLMEFRGAINDEVGAWQGTVIRVDKAGLVPHFGDIDGANKDALRDYFRRESGGKTIEAQWDNGEGLSWGYKTDIPHETFNVVEDGEPYCRGIVFALADVDAP
jgi:hypothetical protein